MESDYNGAICETTFETLFRLGVFGPIDDMPPALQQTGVEFEYESPLHDAIEEQKGQQYLEAQALIAEAMNIDRGAAFMMDTRTALRDALTGVGIPAEWLNSREDVDEMIENEAAAEEEQLQLEQMVQGSEAAKNLAAAGENLEMV